MQLIPDATKTIILQPYIGVAQGLIPYSTPMVCDDKSTSAPAPEDDQELVDYILQEHEPCY
jgi:hypothetical protein